MNKYFRYFLILLAAGTAARIYIAAHLGLGIDEAHYYQYAVHPALSYYDHPPLVGYLIRFFLALGGRTALMVRMPAIAAGVGTMALLWYLGRKLFSPAAAFWAVVFFNLIPMFSSMGGIMVVPDVILSVFWLAAAAILWNVYEIGHRNPQSAIRSPQCSSPGDGWYVLGVVTGLALLTKYTAFLVYPAILLFTAGVPELRPWLKRKEPYLAFLASAALFLPVLVWNYQHHWVSFGFQLSHGFEKKVLFDAETFGRNLGAQAGSFSPLIFFLFLFTAVQCAVAAWRKDARYFLLAAFVLPVLALFGFSSLGNEVLPHWPALGYLILLPAVGAGAASVFYSAGGTQHAVRKVRWARGYLIVALALGGVMTLMVPLQALWKTLPIPADVDPTNDLVGWDAAARRVLEMEQRHPGDRFFVFTHKFYLASELAFALPPDSEILCLSDRPDQYDFWQQTDDLPRTLQGRNGIFFFDDRFRADPRLMYRFRAIGPEETLDVYARGKFAKRFYFYRCYGFDTEKTPVQYLVSIPPPKAVDGAAAWNEQAFGRVNSAAGRNRAVDLFFTMAGWLGSGYVLVPLVGWLIWLRRRKPFWLYFGLFAAMLIIGGIAVHHLKHSLKVDRPVVQLEGKQTVRVIGPVLRGGSFPSGHTQSVFTGVFFLSWFWPQFWYLYWTAGLLTGLSRCYVGAHFPLDVIGGAAVAFLSFFIVMTGYYYVMRRGRKL